MKTQSIPLNFLQSISILLLLLSSCKAPQVSTSIITKDSVIVREIPRIIEIPGQTIQSPTINIDSLVHLIQSGVKSETITNTLTYTDPDTQMQVGLLIDQLGNISAICEQQEQTIRLLEKEIERLRTIETTTEIKTQPTFWEQIKNYILIAIVILGIIALISFLRGLGVF
ncbi:hypothetical protein [Cyclobacterium jeungdonense]|uniref:Uncharacterized protein n=1 Tax=Cyclobacterium jeungdonense TaxID=708087 RepID=A0ABT8CAA0_9BACT|nr:hypothetical protein [Cyclobacterium jeungdonense]MDN3688695.1 hypothetical protein [Cyclobacterium jeungdonense]